MNMQCIFFSYPITVLDRPLGLQEVEAPSISRQSAHEDGKAVSPMHQLPSVTIIYFNLIHYLTGILNLAPKCDIFYCTYPRKYDYFCTLWFNLLFEIEI
jgi:hypothetical protein